MWTESKWSMITWHVWFLLLCPDGKSTSTFCTPGTLCTPNHWNPFKTHFKEESGLRRPIMLWTVSPQLLLTLVYKQKKLEGQSATVEIKTMLDVRPGNFSISIPSWNYLCVHIGEDQDTFPRFHSLGTFKIGQLFDEVLSSPAHSKIHTVTMNPEVFLKSFFNNIFLITYYADQKA